MELFIETDSFQYEVASRLTTTDLFWLRLVSRKFYKKSNILFSFTVFSIINNQIKTVFGSDTESFKVALRSTKASIGGSFVLECLLGRLEGDFDAGDLDVYVPDPFAKPYQFNDVENFAYAILGAQQWNSVDGSKKYHAIPHLTYVRTYYLEDRGLKLDIVSYSDKNMKKKRPNYKNKMAILDDMADFEIVKNFYTLETRRNRLHIANAVQVFERVCKFESNCDYESSLMRMLKYEERGFQFVYPTVNQLNKMLSKSYVQMVYGSYDDFFFNCFLICEHIDYEQLLIVIDKNSVREEWKNADYHFSIDQNPQLEYVTLHPRDIIRRCSFDPYNDNNCPYHFFKSKIKSNDTYPPHIHYNMRFDQVQGAVPVIFVERSKIEPVSSNSKDNLSQMNTI